MTNVENKQEIISVGKTNILDISEYRQERRFYALTADVFDGAGEKVGRQVLLKDIVFSEQGAVEFIERSKDHIGNIQGIQSRNGGHLEDVRLFNLSIDEAEQKGFLHKPGVIQHIPK